MKPATYLLAAALACAVFSVDASAVNRALRGTAAWIHENKFEMQGHEVRLQISHIRTGLTINQRTAIYFQTSDGEIMAAVPSERVKYYVERFGTKPSATNGYISGVVKISSRSGDAYLDLGE